MIRALIATINSASTTLEQTADRELIAKVIRQGGRRVWIDAADADTGERDWISQTFDLPPTLLDADYALSSHERGLTLCLQSVIFQDSHYETLPVIIHATLNAATLVSLRSVRVKAIDDVFNRAAKSEANWKDSTAPLIYQVVAAVMDTLVAALGSAANSYTDTSNALIGNTFPNDLPKLLTNLYQWRTDAAQLADIAAPYHLMIDALAGAELIAPRRDLAEHFSTLSMALEQRQNTVQRCLVAVEPLLMILHSRQSVDAAAQSARLGRIIRGIRALLFVMLPLIAAALTSLVLPVPAGIGFLASVIFLVVLYVVEFVIILLARFGAV